MLSLIAPVPATRPRLGGAEVAWVELLGEARANSRPPARRAFATLVVGLSAVTPAAALVTAFLDLTGILPADFQVGAGGLGGLAHTDHSTVLVALAAGGAAMLSFETRASTAVGVAIAVDQRGAAALAVLLANVALLIASGTATLLVQRWMTMRLRGTVEQSSTRSGG